MITVGFLIAIALATVIGKGVDAITATEPCARTLIQHQEVKEGTVETRTCYEVKP